MKNSAGLQKLQKYSMLPKSYANKHFFLLGNLPPVTSSFSYSEERRKFPFLFWYSNHSEIFPNCFLKSHTFGEKIVYQSSIHLGPGHFLNFSPSGPSIFSNCGMQLRNTCDIDPLQIWTLIIKIWNTSPECLATTPTGFQDNKDRLKLKRLQEKQTLCRSSF